MQYTAQRRVHRYGSGAGLIVGWSVDPTPAFDAFLGAAVRSSHSARTRGLLCLVVSWIKDIFQALDVEETYVG